MWVLPPPHLVAARVLAEDQIGVTVAIDVPRCATRFDTKARVVDHAPVPGRSVVSVPNDRWHFRALDHDEVINTVSVDIHDQRSGLLITLIRRWQLLSSPALGGLDGRNLIACDDYEQGDCRGRQTVPQSILPMHA